MHTERFRLIKAVPILLLCVVLTVCFSVFPVKAEEGDTPSVEEIVNGMSIDEKVSQMIIPAIRSWNGTNVTDLNAFPELMAALRNHQYGGIILYAANVTGTEQVARLVSDLQVNNAKIENVSYKIPYLMPIDEEGGIVLRLTTGTRMTGNMAIGATWEDAEANALTTGKVIGEELAALGLNANFAPDIDVNNNPSNPVIGTRAFSDDPEVVTTLGTAYGKGLELNNVISTYKHFPGHGDTGTDSHVGLPSVEKTLDQLKQNELIPFEAIIKSGAPMIMTAHITLPKYDDPVVFPDGTEGFYPATMSRKVITELLREEMAYDGVVVTDALEMEAIAKGHFVEGAEGSVEYQVNIAEKIINAGVDMILFPIHLNQPQKALDYDEYIDGIIQKVDSGEISEELVDASVTRILELKQKYGILDTDTSGSDIEERIENAKKVVGSPEHHERETEIARKAITLVKNDNLTLPLSGNKKKIVILGRQKGDDVTIKAALSILKDNGIIPSDAFINDLADGTTSGSSESGTTVTIDYHYDTAAKAMRYSDKVKEAVKEADSVIVISKTFDISSLVDSSVQYQVIHQVLTDANESGAETVILSDNLPYDSARYQEADAIVLAYMGTGMNLDPTERQSSSIPAYNSNVIMALGAIFDAFNPVGNLPVNVYSMGRNEKGELIYTDQILYPRGYSLSYEYGFTEGAGSEYTEGDTEELVFKENARFATLKEVLIDGNPAPETSFDSWEGSTYISLLPGFLKTLSEGSHTLTAVHDYGEGEVPVSTEFTVRKAGEGSEDDPVLPDNNTDNNGTSGGKRAENDPKTGDQNDSLIWLVLLFASLTGISGFVLYKMSASKKSKK